MTLRPAPGLGQDSWKPDCLAVMLDGDLLYCNDQLSDFIGTNPGDIPAFTDTDVTNKSCATCYASVLTHGPMVGHTTTSSARIWVRTASRLPVEVRYGTDPTLTAAATHDPGAMQRSKESSLPLPGSVAVLTTTSISSTVLPAWARAADGG